uniref:Uncharacterized protein n=1 Tax=Cacopsylla melanoneura TaxID=428564 RepID=A0A8D8TS55_9HEMI
MTHHHLLHIVSTTYLIHSFYQLLMIHHHLLHIISLVLISLSLRHTSTTIRRPLLIHNILKLIRLNIRVEYLTSFLIRVFRSNLFGKVRQYFVLPVQVYENNRYK